MKVIVFGATGMLGSGLLRACLLDPEVQQILSLGRSLTGQQHPKLLEQQLPSLAEVADYGAVDWAAYDACFFCLGVSAAGMNEAAYTRVTYDITLAAAQALAKANPRAVFLYVSGAGTDSSEKGRSMWARVKGKTENALLKLPLKAAYMLRPGYIQPMHGIRSRTLSYRIIYALAGPLYPLLRALFPNSVTDADRVSQAMLQIAKNGAPKKILEGADIDSLTHAA